MGEITREGIQKLRRLKFRFDTMTNQDYFETKPTWLREIDCAAIELLDLAEAALEQPAEGVIRKKDARILLNGLIPKDLRVRDLSKTGKDEVRQALCAVLRLTENTANACPACPDYIGKCPKCGRSRPSAQEFIQQMENTATPPEGELTLEQLESGDDLKGSIDGVSYMLDALKDVIIRRSDLVDLINKARAAHSLEDRLASFVKDLRTAHRDLANRDNSITALETQIKELEKETE